MCHLLAVGEHISLTKVYTTDKNSVIYVQINMCVQTVILTDPYSSPLLFMAR